MSKVEVAVKVVRPNLAMLAKFRARFAREVALSAQLVHPHVVPMYDKGRLKDGRPYVALAYANRGSLTDVFEKGEVAEGFRLLDQVLEALSAIHARGLLHQDLKPGNVLLHSTRDAVDAWVADLGVAGALSEFALDRKGMSGTPIWMAPEQLQLEPAELGPWTDLYAVGLMLYMLLGGKPVQPTIARNALLELRKAPPPPLEGVPSALNNAIRTLLDPDPRQRFDRAADVRRALRDAKVGWGPERLEPTGHRTVVPAQTTSFADAIPIDDEIAQFRGGVAVPAGPAPKWTRVPPDPLPPSFPEEGGGAPDAGLELIALREPALVGREELLAELWGRAREVMKRGEPQVVVLSGPTGSGKSRLAGAIATALDEGGFMERITLRYHSPAGADDGYRGAVRELLVPWNDNRDAMEARLCRWLARERRAPQSQVQSEAAVLCRWCGYVRRDETPVNAALGLAYLYRYLDAHAWRGGACLVLEDVHNARGQGDGLEICEALLEKTVGRRPVLTLCTLDDAALEADPPLRARVDSLLSRGALLLRTDRLPLAKVRQFLGTSLSLAPDLAAVISTECHGSPLYANLLVRDWASRGMLVRTNYGNALKPGVPLLESLPKDLPSLAASRVDGALQSSEDPKGALEALQATVLAGPYPPVHVVRAINPEGLDALLGTGLVSQDGWRLRFEHDLVQAAALALTERSETSALHARLADAWRDLGERTGSDVDLPHGTHRVYARQAERALDPLLNAARTMVDEGRPALALAAGQLAVQAADAVKALDLQVEARRHVTKALLELDRTAEAGAMLDEIDGFGELDRRTKAITRSLRARVAMAHGELDQAKKLLQHAAMTLDTVRDVDALTEAFHGQAILLRLSGRPKEAVERFERMIKMNKDNPLVEAKALNGLLEARIASGDYDGVEAGLERLRSLAQQTGDTRNIAHYHYTQGLLHLRKSRLEESERCFRTAQALAATLGADVLTLACQNNLGEVFRHKGDVQAAESCYRYVARFAADRKWGAHAAVAHLNIAGLAMQRGKPRQARAEVEQAERFLVDSPQHWAWLYVGLCRAVWAAEEADERTCRQWWKVALDRGLGRVLVPELRPLLGHLGTLAQRRGWNDLARQAQSFVS